MKTSLFLLLTLAAVGAKAETFDRAYSDPHLVLAGFPVPPKPDDPSLLTQKAAFGMSLSDYIYPLKGRAVPVGSAAVSATYTLDHLDGLLKLAPNRELGASNRAWNLGVAADPSFTRIFVTLTPVAGGPTILKELDKPVLTFFGYSTVDMTVDGTSYRISVAGTKSLHPIQDGSLSLSVAQGTGKEYKSVPFTDLKEGMLAAAPHVEIAGKTLSIVYGTDADPAAGKLASTRSFAFASKSDKKLWTLPESALTALKPDEALAVDFGGTKALLRLTAGALEVLAGP